MKINRFYSNYIIFVFIVKIIFLILAITNKYLLIKGNNPTLQKQVYIWREKVEYFFVILMALLCIGLYITYPSPTIAVLVALRDRVVISTSIFIIYIIIYYYLYKLMLILFI